MPPKQRTFLTNAQKLQLKQFWSEHPDLQLLAVVDWVRERFGVSVGRATLYRIYHAPVETLERDILGFYEENRRLGESSGVALSDDALLRAAAELRSRHGISAKELKLSNGWLHRFKERHALRVVPHAKGQTAQATVDAAEVATETDRVITVKPKRKPRAPRKCHSEVESATAGRCVVNNSEESNDAVTMTTFNTVQQPWAYSASASRTLEDGVDIATTSIPTAVIQPLTYLSATATGSVVAVGFVRWRLCGGIAHANHFSLDNDGVSILRNATYQVNVELQHAVSPPGSPSVIFKVWAGVELLGQCDRYIRSEGGRALSVLQQDCTLSARTIIRVEYHATGLVYNSSRLVLRVLNEFT
ncbi:Hypothetical protein PHPALM_37571 [Phytophthora palmivora]|uniref:HTH CENPB-type domain-containing protein n=1 Tax=Phytophthora palmivora TaxID=4796 RepID=A0A2P4WX33_9STRA|nr:Hypothetical protein PHPALM_37571 [Phytophthora palmivora]